MTENTIIASRIKKVRHDSGLTQEQMAELLGISRNTLAAWEAGTREPHAGEIMSFCDKFAVTFDYLCGRSESNQEIKYEKYEIDWLKMSPMGRFLLYEIYKLFISKVPFCSLRNFFEK